MLKSALMTVCLMTLAALAVGCSTSVYQPGRAANFQLDAAREINDDDIRKAYEARPQMEERLGVAFYSFDPDKSESIHAMLEETAHVETVYNIPDFLMSGRGRYDAPNRYREPQPPSLKKMRLLAARAHCDVLLIFDYGYKVESAPNGLTALNVLMLPVFFTPFLDQKVESHFDAYIIDVRNGYLYGQISSTEESIEESVTIWHADGEPYIEDQWPMLLEKTGAGLGDLISAEISATAEARTTPLDDPSPPSEVDP